MMYKTLLKAIENTRKRSDDNEVLKYLQAIYNTIDMLCISDIDIEEAEELQDIINNYIRQIENDIKALNK